MTQDINLVYGTTSVCTEHPEVANLLAPIASVVNPLQLLENTGSFKSTSLIGFLQSSTASATQGQSSQPTLNSNKQCAQQLGTPVGGAIPPGPPPPSGACSSTYGGLTGVGDLAGSSNINQEAVTPGKLSLSQLSSGISGYMVTPYTYTLTWTYTRQPSGSAVMTGNPAPGASCSYVVGGGGSGSETLDAYNITEVTTSTPYNAIVQAGSTFLVNQLNGSYYVPQLSDSNVIAPYALIYNVDTNRIFGSVYLNATTSPTSDYQVILDAIQWLNYNQVAFTQGTGGYPAYQAVKSQASPAKISPTAAPTLLANTQNVQQGLNAQFGYEQYLNPTLVSLFDWYEGFAYDSPLQFIVNNGIYSSPSGPQNLQGYVRFVYAFNDKFNNTIYAPIDADVARITNIGMTIVPQVSVGNANQTTLKINGTVGTTDVNGNFIPLTNSPIYLYYDTNLNYLYNGRPATPEQASLCAFAPNAIAAKGCQLADPISPNPIEAAVGNTPNYVPTTNVLNVCPAAANSLLAPPNLDCNIYQNHGTGNDGIPLPSGSTTPSGSTWYGTSCPGPGITPAGGQEYCLPLYDNGTGTCTSEVGRITAAGGGPIMTNSIGDFSVNVLACGTGSVTLYAQYYGWPPPEPILANQHLLQAAYTPEQSIVIPDNSFPVYNYYWTPNVTATSTQIGELLLSYGNITAIALAICVFAAIAIMLALRKKEKPKRRHR